MITSNLETRWNEISLFMLVKRNQFFYDAQRVFHELIPTIPGNLKSWFTIKRDMLISQLFQTLLNTQPLQNKTQKIPHREKFFYLIGFVRQALFKVCGVAFLWQKLYISLWFTHLSLKLEIKDSPWIIHIHCILSSIYMHFCPCIPRRFCQTNMPLHIF